MKSVQVHTRGRGGGAKLAILLRMYFMDASILQTPAFKKVLQQSDQNSRQTNQLTIKPTYAYK